ncbi:MAG: DUF1559 domain-containing protein, partial [Planctomycetota bacterium]
LGDAVDLTVGWNMQTIIDSVAIPTYACPSDPESGRPRIFTDGRPTLFPTNYGFNMGTWFVFDPATGEGGKGAVYPNSRHTFGAFSDGLSNTLLVSEVLAWQDYVRNDGAAFVETNYPDLPDSLGTAVLAVNDIIFNSDFVTSPGDFKNTGHTEWPDGRVHHQGFTTALPPNVSAVYEEAGEIYDVDFTSWQEGRDGSNGTRTYAAITSRSRHVGAVNACLVDGSVRSISENIDLGTWRQLGQRDDGQVLGEF